MQQSLGMRSACTPAELTAQTSDIVPALHWMLQVRQGAHDGCWPRHQVRMLAGMHVCQSNLTSRQETFSVPATCRLSTPLSP